MEFSILNAVRNHPARPRDLSEVYAEFISDAVLAEELGFASCGTANTTSAVSMDRLADARRHRRGRLDRTPADRHGGDVAAVPRSDPRRRGRGPSPTSCPAGGSTSASVPDRQYEEFVTFGRTPAEMNQRSWESIDFIQRAPGAGRVQPRGSLLRHPRHHVHHQARAGSDPDLVGRDGTPQPAPRCRSASTSSDRSTPATTPT